MPKQLIVNADDFGRHTLINRAVEQGVARGLIRSATVMVTGAAFAEAVELARRTPALGMGIHFTLVNARPVLPAAEIPSLVDPATGELYPDHGAFVKRFLTGKIRLQDVKRECTAQLDRFLDMGLVPTHADSHQHMHVLPGIIDIILDLCLDHGIPAVRIPSIPVSLLATRPSNLGEQVGRTGLHVLAERARKKARALGIQAPGHFGLVNKFWTQFKIFLDSQSVNFGHQFHSLDKGVKLIRYHSCSDSYCPNPLFQDGTFPGTALALNSQGSKRAVLH